MNGYRSVQCGSRASSGLTFLGFLRDLNGRGAHGSCAGDSASPGGADGAVGDGDAGEGGPWA